MIILDGPVSPQDAIAFVRNLPVAIGRPLLAAANVTTTDRNEASFSEIVRRNRMAKYRTFDGLIAASQHDSGRSVKVTMPPFSIHDGQKGEYELLQREFARTGGTNTSALTEAVYNDLEWRTSEMYNRAEFALGQVRSTGKFSVNENGLHGFEVDYGLPADNVFTPAALWSSAAAQIWSDIIALNDRFKASAKAPAGKMEVDTAVLRLILTNEQVIQNVYGTAAGRVRATLGDVNAALAGEGLAPIVEVQSQTMFVDGVDVPVTDRTQVRLLPWDESDLFEFRFGLTATALELVNSAGVDFSYSQGPGIVGVIIKDGPPFRQYTFLDAVGMPLINGANRMVLAKVIA